jgi:hypothetical protein
MCDICFYFYIYLGLFSSNKADLSLYDSEENELTTKSLESEELTEGLHEYDGERKTVETTTPMIKTTKHHEHSHNNDVVYYEDHDDETTSSTTLATTTSSSSSSSSLSFSIIRLTTHVLTERTTNTSEIPATSSIDTFSIMVHNRNKQVLMSTTMDSKQIAALQAQTSRFENYSFLIIFFSLFKIEIDYF